MAAMFQTSSIWLKKIASHSVFYRTDISLLCISGLLYWFIAQLKLAEFGVGAVVKHFAKMAGQHWLAEVPVIVGNSHWRYSDGECGEGWSCFFSPLSKCKIDTISPQAVISYSVHQENNQPNVGTEWPTMDKWCAVDGNGKYNVATGRCDCNEGYVVAQVCVDFLRFRGHRITVVIAARPV